ncbi:MAG: N-formylglutamate amidohydrolase [Paracoccaceae bacterium]
MPLQRDHILSARDGAPVGIQNPDGRADILLICEHASNRIPAALDNLGLDDPALQSHVAWDPGALSVAQMLSDKLDATLIFANFSRLVYDCNRPPDCPDAMPAKSEVFAIPGNENIPAPQRAARIREVYQPFATAVSGEILRRIAQNTPPVIITIHSFTPLYFGKTRDVKLGILHDTDRKLADAMLAVPGDFTAQRNQPYGPQDGVTHTLKLHALPNGLLNVMIEVRNDLIATPSAQKNISDILFHMINQALKALKTEGAHA